MRQSRARQRVRPAGELKRTANTYREQPVRDVPRPGLYNGPSTAPKFVPIRIQETTATHCFSVCLYREPEYKPKSRDRMFEARFLSHWRTTRALLESDGIALNIFCDREMLETALALGYGSVFLVVDPPKFAFDQHIWRYLSALLPEHPTIKCYHFRGMDNIVRLDLERPLWAALEAGEVNVIHAPYLAVKMQKLMPVRGSFSASGISLEYLARWINSSERRCRETETERWHSDELWLKEWWDKDGMNLTPLTVVDRALPAAWIRELIERMEAGGRFQVVHI